MMSPHLFVLKAHDPIELRPTEDLKVLRKVEDKVRGWFYVHLDREKNSVNSVFVLLNKNQIKLLEFKIELNSLINE